MSRGLNAVTNTRRTARPTRALPKQQGFAAAAKSMKLYIVKRLTGEDAARSTESGRWQEGQPAAPLQPSRYSAKHTRQNACPHAATTCIYEDSKVFTSIYSISH